MSGGTGEPHLERAMRGSDEEPESVTEMYDFVCPGLLKQLKSDGLGWVRLRDHK